MNTTTDDSTHARTQAWLQQLVRARQIFVSAATALWGVSSGIFLWMALRSSSPGFLDSAAIFLILTALILAVLALAIGRRQLGDVRRVSEPLAQAWVYFFRYALIVMAAAVMFLGEYIPLTFVQPRETALGVLVTIWFFAHCILHLLPFGTRFIGVEFDACQTEDQSRQLAFVMAVVYLILAMIALVATAIVAWSGLFLIWLVLPALWVGRYVQRRIANRKVETTATEIANRC